MQISLAILVIIIPFSCVTWLNAVNIQARFFSSLHDQNVKSESKLKEMTHYLKLRVYYTIRLLLSLLLSIYCFCRFFIHLDFLCSLNLYIHTHMRILFFFYWNEQFSHFSLFHTQHMNINTYGFYYIWYFFLFVFVRFHFSSNKYFDYSYSFFLAIWMSRMIKAHMNQLMLLIEV